MIFADRFPARYFVEEYGLDYYAAFPGCADDTEPSAKTVAFLIDKVKAENVKAVFYIEFSNQKMADVISEETGCEKLLFHCCHNVTSAQLDEGISYLGLMEQNLETLREALS
jgi:zinc transport system substrate-binding protein